MDLIPFTMRGYFFHKKHFTCRKCNRPLDKNAVLVNNEVYCSNCACLAPSSVHMHCSVCGAVTGEGSAIVASNCYCPTHFSCVVCRSPLTLESCHLRGGQIYCNEHVSHRKYAFCPKCHRRITTDFVEIDGVKWHRECIQSKDEGD